MILYISKTGNKMSGKLLRQEFFCKHICISPHYKVWMDNPKASILLDSGAFQDRGKEDRLSFKDALARQLKHEKKMNFISQRIVSYDYIGNVEETLKANKFLIRRREELSPRQLVLTCQGNTIKEYIYCIIETLKMMDRKDCLGIGGNALAGKDKGVRKKLLDIFKFGIPLILNKGIKQIHIFGVATFDILKEIRYYLNIFEMMGYRNANKLRISVDSSTYEIQSTLGKVINMELEKWEKIYYKEDKFVNYHPADLAIENMKRGMKIIKNI